MLKFKVSRQAGSDSSCSPYDGFNVRMFDDHGKSVAVCGVWRPTYNPSVWKLFHHIWQPEDYESAEEAIAVAKVRMRMGDFTLGLR
jgi:hypothetical protein